MTFKDFNFVPSVWEGLAAMGYEIPTPVQADAIPKILSNKDLIAVAQTGTGKTAAYLLPIIHKIALKNDNKGTNTIIIAPTRELAVQIDQQMEGLAYFTSVNSLAVYGGGDGDSFVREKNALIQGADIIIATPGRLIAHLNMGYVKFQNLEHLVLDEADRMLDMGFNEDIMRIISNLPQQRQTLLFSATMPPKIRELASKILKDPDSVDIAISKPASGVMQAAFMVYDSQKIGLIKHLLQAKEMPSVVIFCSTKIIVKTIEKELRKLNLNAKAIHSDLEQGEREDVLREFRSRKLQVLVATDILSRGIDIEGISLVINYDVPHDPEDYIHRIGRTARAASKGIAFTFINEKEQNKFFRIEQFLGNEIRKAKVPASLGEAPVYAPRTSSSERSGKRTSGKTGGNSRKRASSGRNKKS